MPLAPAARASRRQASPPAAPARHLLDLTMDTCAARSEIVPPPQTLASAYGMVAARLCALPGESRQGRDGWVLPGAALTDERWVARLRQALVDAEPHADCRSGPSGPAFVLALEELDGTIIGYRSQDLTCAGRVAVAAYLETWPCKPPNVTRCPRTRLVPTVAHRQTPYSTPRRSR
jgi:hypothetical protein